MACSAGPTVRLLDCKQRLELRRLPHLAPTIPHSLSKAVGSSEHPATAEKAPSTAVGLLPAQAGLPRPAPSHGFYPAHYPGPSVILAATGHWDRQIRHMTEQPRKAHSAPRVHVYGRSLGEPETVQPLPPVSWGFVEEAGDGTETLPTRFTDTQPSSEPISHLREA